MTFSSRYDLEDSKLKGPDSTDKPLGVMSREMSDFDAGVWVRDIKAIQERYLFRSVFFLLPCKLLEKVRPYPCWITYYTFVAFCGRAVKSTKLNSGVSDQLSVCLSPSCDTCVLKQAINDICCVLQMVHKAVGPVCCVMHITEPSALIIKRRGSPHCSCFDWQLFVPQFLLNYNMVLCKGIVT